MDIVDLFLQTGRGNWYIDIKRDRYSKLAMTVPTSKTIATRVTNESMDQQLFIYGIPTNQLTSNGIQFLMKNLAILGALLGYNQLTIKVYHSHADIKTRQFCNTFLPTFDGMS